ncbi:MAG: type V CRISPR-associated protein Cas12b [Thermodesulfobacteriota bacterium]
MPKQDDHFTQRAYTLRLRGADPNDLSWRETLWKTHEAVNKGAKVFGDWLLTLRGGLDHTLADTQIKQKDRSGRNPADEKRKARRILLALSWLSVESEIGAPADYIIASGKEAAENRNRKVMAALEEILKSRNLADNEIGEWLNDCSASLSAAIRGDAVWVNRSKAFDDAVRTFSGLSREYARVMIMDFFGPENNYLRLPAASGDDEFGIGTSSDDGPEFRTLARQWVSTNFGTGQKSDTDTIVNQLNILANADLKQFAGENRDSFIKNLCDLIGIQGEDSDALRSGIGWSTGRKSKGRLAISSLPNPVTAEAISTLQRKFKEEADDKQSKLTTRNVPQWMPCLRQVIEQKCGMPFRGNRDHIGEYSVILDHAARRVSLAHTWIKRAEAERRRFDEDAQRMDNVPGPVKEWLDEFCRERSGTSGAVEPYRIRRRAVDGWKEVVAAWSKAECKNAEDRIAAARALQDDPEIDKFGDIQLFEALAEDDAVCVWHKDGDAAKTPDPQLLIDYVLAAEAEFKKRHFKVPAYRHPDALLHPVFCDFGKSRWDIAFEIHRQAKPKKRQRGKAKDDFPNLRALSLTLWTGSEMKPVPLCWQSKRLARDLALGQDTQNDEASKEVTRADRLGRAASNVTKSDAVKISKLFEQKDWNGRLQAPRQQLEAIARYVEKHGWDQKAEKMRDRIQWLVTFSARLQPKGPYDESAETNPLGIDPQSWPHADLNKTRKGLARLPGLRVLSVDLGHRYAAACAVWEALSSEDMKKACRDAGHEEPEECTLYLHLKKKVERQKKGKIVEVEETTIYRRIGADTLSDDRQHPAPWARLDRQFLIKLQGEEEGAREASNEEIWKVHQLEVELGRTTPMIDRLAMTGWGQSGKQRTRLEALRELGWKPVSEAGVFDGTDADEGEVRKPSLSVDELMSSAVRTMRLALKRHGDRARIAHYLITEEKTNPGGIKEKLDQNKQIDLLLDALVMWHGLFSSRGWRDEAARQLWDDRVAKLSGYKAPKEIGGESSGSERKNKQKENREKLYDVAKALAQDATLRQALHDAWKSRWENDDERWKKLLRWFKDWILPRGKSSDDPAIRKVGGLSLTRLATLTEFRRKIQVGFFTRLRPDGTRAEIKEDFGQSALDALEHLREQRVKQLASRIAEAALGIGRIRRPMGGKTPKRPNARVDKPCHAIVIEDLTHYRPEETRTRRENRQLMTWSSSKVKKYLAEACQLHGLHLREVSASYTSRQDSRTGAPGIRCEDVSVKEFMRSPFWRKQVAQAEKKQAEGKGDARERFLCTLNAKWKDKTVTDWEGAGVIRIPLNGGEVFVSADPNSPAAKGIHADLNAAANIGLRALTDPDWPGKWWYVPCDPASFKPIEDKVGGSKAINLEKPLREPAQTQSGEAATDKKKGGRKGAGKSKEVVNLWRDISSFPTTFREIGEWREYAAYQNEVQCRVIRVLEEQIKDRDKQQHDGHKENDIPF